MEPIEKFEQGIETILQAMGDGVIEELYVANQDRKLSEAQLRRAHTIMRAVTRYRTNGGSARVREIAGKRG